jgi:restriction system protein
VSDRVNCAECGAQLNVIDDENENRRSPCPMCGSKKRKYTLEAKSGFYVIEGNEALLLKKSTSELLLQTVVVPGQKTNEGRLIESVAIPWFDIIELLRKDPTVAFQISPRKWEEIVAGAYSKAGFDEVTLTPRSGDFGRDVIAIKRGIGSIRVIDQVKAYNKGHLVTANDVRALMGILGGDRASKGFLTTTSDFAPMLNKDPLITPFIPAHLELINGTQLLKRLEVLAKA